MPPTDPHIEIRRDAGKIYEDFRLERQQTLVAPEDDMWASFADNAEALAIIVDGQAVGCCAIDEDNQLLMFHVAESHEELALELFDYVAQHRSVVAAMPSTVDPRFLSVSLSAGGRAEPVALMYHLVAEPESKASVDVRVATNADYQAAIAFDKEATDSPEEFLQKYIATRIAGQELYLMLDENDRIVATGECRVDTRADGHAQLGLIVGTDLRGRGIGTRLFHTLVEIARAKDLVPLCSTEPTNAAAQRVIHRAGFRNRDRVFRVALTEAPRAE